MGQSSHVVRSAEGVEPAAQYIYIYIPDPSFVAKIIDQLPVVALSVHSSVLWETVLYRSKTGRNMFLLASVAILALVGVCQSFMYLKSCIIIYFPHQVLDL